MLPMPTAIVCGRRNVLPTVTISGRLAGLREKRDVFLPACCARSRSISEKLPIRARPPGLVVVPTSPEFCPFCIYSSQASSVNWI